LKTVEILFWVFFAIVLYTYAGYGIVMFFAVKIKEAVCRPRPSQLPSPAPDVTLMIAAWNEESIVEEKMANCRELQYPGRLTVCWVTDGSTDGTNELLKKYPDVKVVFSPERRGKTAALNHGMDGIDTPIVIFTDANTMLNPHAVTNIVRRFSDQRVGCVAGEKRIAAGRDDGSAAEGEGLYWRYESTLKDLDSRLWSAVGAAGELFAVRSELFEQMPQDTLLDDFILSMRITMKGYRIAYAPDAYAVEGGSANMREEQKRKVRIAAGGLQSIARLTPLLNIFRYGVLSFEYISHRVLRWSLTPVVMLALLPLNVALVCTCPDSPLWRAMLAGQAAFYLAGFAGKILADNGVRSPLIVPYYFLFMNLNVFLGVHYLWRRKRGGVSSGAWEKARRA
jgi:cellulose synthase/poly-beta-1,6-N-acetylglucosamine synthase-like glycosyltransferase